MSKGIAIIYPLEVRDFIARNYRGIKTAELVGKINAAFGTAYTCKQLRTYKKRHGFRSGNDGRFKPGQISFNKGKTWNEFMKPEKQAASRRTSFKKGMTPHNHKLVGTEAIRPGKKKNHGVMVWIKVAEPNKWREKHRLVWEQAHGPIPAGHLVIFADGNLLNTDLSNLILINKAQNATINRCIKRGKDPETTKSAIALADLKHAIARVLGPGQSRKAMA